MHNFKPLFTPSVSKCWYTFAVDSKTKKREETKRWCKKKVDKVRKRMLKLRERM